MTFSTTRVAGALCGGGALALAASTFLSWRQQMHFTLWQLLAGLDYLAGACVFVAVSAAFVPRLRPIATIVALATLTALVLKTSSEPYGAVVGTSLGPRIAFPALVAIAVGGVIERPRAAIGVGAVALLVSTFGSWYADDLSQFTGEGFGILIVFGDLPNAWESFVVVDVLLVAAAVVAVIGRGRIAIAAAAAGLALVLWRSVDPPLSRVVIASAEFTAAAALLAIAAGGALTRARSR